MPTSARLELDSIAPVLQHAGAKPAILVSLGPESVTPMIPAGFRHAVSIGAAMAIGVAASAALAFGTINAFSQHAEHENITRLGLSSLGIGPKTMTEIAGTKGAFGAVGAPEGRLLSQKSAHCDGGDYFDVPGYPQSKKAALKRLKDCRAWIFAKLKEAVRDAGALVDAAGTIDGSQVPTIIPCTYDGTKSRAKCNVLEDLGLAFHAAQDFYAHSNWTDQPGPGPIGPENPPGLGQKERAAWIDPRQAVAPPAGLISECFGIPEASSCTYGNGAKRVMHKILNKDEGLISKTAIGPGETPRGKINGNFERAVNAAIDDTADKWLYFEQQVHAAFPGARGKRIVCVVKSDTPDNC